MQPRRSALQATEDLGAAASTPAAEEGTAKTPNHNPRPAPRKPASEPFLVSTGQTDTLTGPTWSLGQSCNVVRTVRLWGTDKIT